jgi:hypothetical protein
MTHSIPNDDGTSVVNNKNILAAGQWGSLLLQDAIFPGGRFGGQSA